jgi:cytochrome P450
MPKGLPLAMPPPGSGLRPVPGDPGPPIIGYTFRFLRDPLGWGMQRYAEYGQVSWAKAFGTTLVTLLGPDAHAAVLLNRDKAFSNGKGWEYFIGPFFRRGLMLLDFDEHHHHRRIMQEAFTNERLAGYLTGMNETIARGIERWQPGNFLVLPALKQLTLDVATEMFMGSELGATADRVNRAFIDTVRAGTSFVRFPVPGGRWAKGLRGRKVLESFLTGFLQSKRGGDGDDLFSALCQVTSEDGHQFTDEDIINHMIFLLMAAHDTSTITTSTIAYYLAKNPGWQERVREESLALGSKTLGYDDIDKLTSLDLVMRESLRLVSPVPALARRAVKDTVILGHFIPRGTLVSAGIGFTHHLPEYWPEPDRFDPERFAEDRREDKVHPHAWEPFGTGAHKCIGLRFGGMEIKAIVHQVLQRFRLSVPPDYEMPIDTTSLPVPADGLPVTLERIEP